MGHGGNRLPMKKDRRIARRAQVQTDKGKTSPPCHRESPGSRSAQASELTAAGAQRRPLLALHLPWKIGGVGGAEPTDKGMLPLAFFFF